MESLGKRLKLIRARLRWSQTESARKMAIEQSYLSKLENDQALPSADTLENICRVYGVDVQQLLVGLEEQLRRKPELQVLQQSTGSAPDGKRWSSMPVRLALSLVILFVFTGLGIAIALGPVAGREVPGPEHEMLSMKLEQVNGREVLEMFAEFGGLQVSGLELVHGDIDHLQIDQVPWDVALAQVAEKLGLRAKISGGYVTLIPLQPARIAPETERISL
ncbi:helix-turn-helix domain-containing protein [Microbulbifer sp. CAU 1566]|uniref:helix-turn-helix domain-containing protein n=1 Tax=Microbulbifer sp. CAU 1566 TaxID=2933269 RepID=UPI0020044B91|nr:helix-turn-helix domain-containing protein [Microbulbifer sp. CAU 1566]MCK7598628.1 helix-turn-helix domain-containing protein [Microbulbifer sp. CAU 1566]